MAHRGVVSDINNADLAGCYINDNLYLTTQWLPHAKNKLSGFRNEHQSVGESSPSLDVLVLALI